MVQVELQALHANDNGDGNGMPEVRPQVRVPMGRPEHAYAHQGNLILPLRFARLMPGWQVADGEVKEPATAAAPAPAPPAPRRTAASRRPPSARLWRLGLRRAPASR